MLDLMLPFYPANTIASYSDKITIAYYLEKCSMICRFLLFGKHIYFIVLKFWIIILFLVHTQLVNRTFSGNFETKMLNRMLLFYSAKNIANYSDKNTAPYSKKCSTICRFFHSENISHCWMVCHLFYLIRPLIHT
jgi:hypothetical protein